MNSYNIEIWIKLYKIIKQKHMESSFIEVTYNNPTGPDSHQFTPSNTLATNDEHDIKPDYGTSCDTSEMIIVHDNGESSPRVSDHFQSF